MDRTSLNKNWSLRIAAVCFFAAISFGFVGTAKAMPMNNQPAAHATQLAWMYGPHPYYGGWHGYGWGPRWVGWRPYYYGYGARCHRSCYVGWRGGLNCVRRCY